MYWIRAKILNLLCALHVVFIFTLYLKFHTQYHLANLSVDRSNLPWCHYDNEGNILPSTESITRLPDSIFFLETSCKGYLNSRQACSVESAARLHPQREVHVYFSSPVSEHTLNYTCLSELRKFRNVKLARLHSIEYARGTPLGDMIAHRAGNWSIYPIEHTSDLMRFLTLYKFGGVYLDMDMMVVKSLDPLGRNWAARECNDTIAVAALALGQDEIGRTLLTKILNAIAEDFRPTEWGYNGAGAMARALETFCNTTRQALMSADTCRGLQIYESEVTYPVCYASHHIYFDGERDLIESNKTHIHHFWNYLSKGLEVENGSLYENLARKYCPTIRKLFGHKFGS